jgi:hypothetical protein
MPRYFNVVADTVTPTTPLDHTAAVILGALHTGAPEFVINIDAAIMRDARARLYLKPTAFRALRNMGYAIATYKRGSHSTQQLTDDPADLLPDLDRSAEELYSAMIARCRQMDGAIGRNPDPALIARHQASLSAAIALGGSIGHPVAAVVREAAHL